MTAPRGRVLVVDDEPAFCRTIESALGRRGFAVATRFEAATALDALRSEAFEAMVTDLNLGRPGGPGGLELCRQVHAAHPDLPVLVLTAFGSFATAVEAIRAGAYDFLSKPLDVDALALALDRAVEWRALRAEVRRLRQGRPAPQAGALLGDSAPARLLREQIERIGPTEAGVLITGETGTGKELVARALHEASARARGPFVAVNCAAIPAALLESELFGHGAGAFSGATRARQGLFVQATGGTLLLDEVGDMPLDLQPKLLRVLQERVVRPVGSAVEVPLDVRVLAATNRDLDVAVEQGTFRGDLLFRLDVVRLEVPPLRARDNDVLLLAQQFTTAAAARAGKDVRGITAAAAKHLLAYPWPGNVRELQNAVESAVALTEYDQLTVADLPRKVREHTPSRAAVAEVETGGLVPLAEIERRYILRVLDAVGGRRAEAARILQLDRKTLYRKLLQYGRS